MMRLLIITMLLCTSTAWAGDHFIKKGGDSRFRVSIDLQKGAMMVLPKAPRSVTGITKPNFAVEVYSEKIMITPLRVGARTNLFIDLGDNTIASVEVVGVQGGGEDLINLTYGEAPSKVVPLERINIPTDLKFLSGKWDLRRLNAKASESGLEAKVEYLVLVNDRAVLSFSVTNRSKDTLNISDVSMQQLTMSGLSGHAVAGSDIIPSSVELTSSTLSQGQIAQGVLIAPKLTIEHDQLLSLRVISDGVQGLEVRFSL